MSNAKGEGKELQNMDGGGDGGDGVYRRPTNVHASPRIAKMKISPYFELSKKATRKYISSHVEWRRLRCETLVGRLATATY